MGVGHNGRQFSVPPGIIQSEMPFTSYLSVQMILKNTWFQAITLVISCNTKSSLWRFDIDNSILSDFFPVVNRASAKKSSKWPTAFCEKKLQPITAKKPHL